MKSSRDENVQLTRMYQPNSQGLHTVFVESQPLYLTSVSQPVSDPPKSWDSGNRAAAENKEELREYLKKWLRKHLCI